MNRKHPNLILNVVSGPSSGKSYVIPPGELRTVGRTSAASIETKDDFMSHVHFELGNMEGTARLRDLQSRNKTKVNTTVITAVDLEIGDEISAGKSRFRIAWEACEITGIAEPANDATSPVTTPNQSKRSGSDSPFDSGFIETQPSAKEEPVSPSQDPNREQERDRREPSAEASKGFDSPIGSVDSWYFNNPNASSNVAGDSFFSQATSASSEPDLDRVDSVETPQLGIPSPLIACDWRDPDALDRMFLDSDRRRDTFAKTIQLLSQELDFFVVAHFRKLSVDRPIELPSISLFPRFDPHGQFLPVAITSRNWMVGAHDRFAQRLVDNDGLLLVLCNTESSSGEEIQTMGRMGFEGFSEPDGFLTWCWPSQLKRMGESISDQALAKWMGQSVGGVVMPVDAIGRIEAIIRPELAKPLEQFGFK